MKLKLTKIALNRAVPPPLELQSEWVCIFCHYRIRLGKTVVAGKVAVFIDDYECGTVRYRMVWRFAYF